MENNPETSEENNPETSRSSPKIGAKDVVMGALSGAVSEAADSLLVKPIPEPIQPMVEAALGHEHEKPKTIIQEVHSTAPSEKNVPDQLALVRAEIEKTKSPSVPQAEPSIAASTPDKTQS